MASKKSRDIWGSNGKPQRAPVCSQLSGVANGKHPAGQAAVKRLLLIYNANDCEALEVVANKLLQLQQLSQNPEQSPDIVFTASLKWKHPFGFKRNKFALIDLDTINKAAY
jgi:hypothetical protein